MGDIKRKRSLFSRPKKPFDKKRIDDENVLIEKYGLKNKREIWKAISAVSKIRRRAKNLIGREEEKRIQFFEKLSKAGLKVTGLADALALTEKDILDRRLQTMVLKKGLSKTAKQARQLITHRQVLVNGGVVNSPSFNVTRELENKISLKERKLKQKESKGEAVE